MKTSAARFAESTLPGVPWARLMGEHVIRVLSWTRDSARMASHNILSAADMLAPHPLHAAVGSGIVAPISCGKLVPSSHECDPVDALGMTPLHWASVAGDAGWVKALISSGANIDMSCEMNRTALHFAVEHGQLGAIKALIEAGACLQIADSMGHSPLLSAVSRGYADVVRLLCSAGADTDFGDLDGKNALFLAVEYGYIDVVRALIEGGLRVDAYFGEAEPTPMHVAARDGRSDIIRMLNKAGGDIECEELESGFTPLMLAVFKGQLQAVITLLHLGATTVGLTHSGEFCGMCQLPKLSLYSSSLMP